jgi:hypothetical protein
VSDTPSPKPTTTVTIQTSGTSVTVTAVEPLDEVAERAQALHQEAYRRRVAAPDGLGGRI